MKSWFLEVPSLEIEYVQELQSLDPQEPLRELVNRGVIPRILEQRRDGHPNAAEPPRFASLLDSCRSYTRSPPSATLPLQKGLQSTTARQCPVPAGFPLSTLACRDQSPLPSQNVRRSCVGPTGRLWRLHALRMSLMRGVDHGLYDAQRGAVAGGAGEAEVLQVRSAWVPDAGLPSPRSWQRLPDVVGYSVGCVLREVR